MSPNPAGRGSDKRLDTASPGYRLAARAAHLRGAVQQAVAALRAGRSEEALGLLEQIESAYPEPCPRCGYALGAARHLDARSPDEHRWCT